MFLATALLAGLAAGAPADVQLETEDADWPALRTGCIDLASTMQSLQGPLSSRQLRDLRELLTASPKDQADATRQVQALLDPFALVAVRINPESRVKVARGPAPARLSLDRPSYFLIKVVNEAGVTHALVVSGPQIRPSASASPGQWLEAVIQIGKPKASTLSGHRVEYQIIKLIAHEAGKREATLKFDVGQGTQDLGFRAELPVLFQIGAGNP
jgi:hypothetical protein